MVRRPWIGPDMELRFEDQSMHVPHASCAGVWYVRSKFWRAEHDSDLYIGVDRVIRWSRYLLNSNNTSTALQL